MINIQYVSDLHLEFDDLDIKNNGADVLVLAGDICVIDYFLRGENSPYFSKSQRFLNFFERINSEFDKTYYVLGNHEYYYGVYEHCVDILREKLTTFQNIKILNGESEEYLGYNFVGGTLWTDPGSEIIRDHISRSLNDFKLIERRLKYNSWGRFTVDFAALEHKKFLNSFETMMNDKTVLITHHAMSPQSIHEKYEGDIINHAYFTDLEEWLIKNKPLLHIHGHVHNSFGYFVGDTRVVTNPRGYVTYGSKIPENTVFDESKIICLNI